MKLSERAGKFPGIAICLAALALFVVPAGGAYAQDVLPGFDLFLTDPSNTELDLHIDSDHFGPGSDPFDGGVPADAVSLPDNPFCPPELTLCPDDDLNGIDTIVERLAPAILPGVGSFDVIDVEIVELSLRSIQPITVTYNGGLNPELWDVHICLAPTQAKGNMLINKTHANGGTFDIDLPVIPLFVFTRQSDGEERQLEGPLDIVEATDVPWEYVSREPLSCRSNFCAAGPFVETGAYFTHGLVPVCGERAVPAMPGTGTLILIAVLAGAGAMVMRRFTRKAASVEVGS